MSRVDRRRRGGVRLRDGVRDSVLTYLGVRLGFSCSASRGLADRAARGSADGRGLADRPGDPGWMALFTAAERQDAAGSWRSRRAATTGRRKRRVLPLYPLAIKGGGAAWYRTARGRADRVERLLRRCPRDAARAHTAGGHVRGGSSDHGGARGRLPHGVLLPGPVLGEPVPAAGGLGVLVRAARSVGLAALRARSPRAPAASASCWCSRSGSRRCTDGARTAGTSRPVWGGPRRRPRPRPVLVWWEGAIRRRARAMGGAEELATRADGPLAHGDRRASDAWHLGGYWLVDALVWGDPGRDDRGAPLVAAGLLGLRAGEPRWCPSRTRGPNARCCRCRGS